jgi:hypothetical protein
MTKAASIEQLRKARTATVTILVDGEPAEFVIRKIKVGEQKRLTVECVDEQGRVDTDKLYCLIAQMCTVAPELSDADVDEMDADIFTALSVEIAAHSGVEDARRLVVADPKEGSALKSFPAA